MWFGRVRMRFGRGSDVVRTWFGCGSDVLWTWFGRVFGSGADSLAKVKGKWFPASLSPVLLFLWSFENTKENLENIKDRQQT